MSSLKNKSKKNNQTNVSLLYDTALPVNLKKKGVESESGSAIKPRLGDAQPSPYIVHLSREVQTSHAEAPQKTALPRAQLIDQLAAELIIDDEDTITIDQIRKNDDIRSLNVSLNDLRAQLAEPEKNAYVLPIRSSKPLLHTDVPEPSSVSVETKTVVLFDEQEMEETALETTQAQRYTPTWENVVARLPKLLSVQVRHRAIASFVILSMLAVLPLHAMQSFVGVTQTRDELTGIGTQAIEELTRGTRAIESQRYDVAQSDFDSAGEHFAQAQSSIENMHLAVAALINLIPRTDRTYDTVRGLVVAGKELSAAASLFAQAAEDLADKKSLTLTQKISLLNTYIAAAQPHLALANEALQKVDPNLIPQDQQGRVQELLTTVPQLTQSVQEFLTFSQMLGTILGDEQKMRYLVSFQNNTELRATGGFTGSFAEMDVLHGAIDNVSIASGGTYDVQGQLASFVEPPQPLSLINSRWEFHDANWFPHFPSSAAKMIDFYNDAGGPTVDGMVAINATLLPTLLAITGPIEMPEYGRTIDSENFLFETQKIVEIEYAQYHSDDTREEDAPKQFIGDLAPKILERLAQGDMETLLAVADALGTALHQKDIQVYFTNNDLQRQTAALGWDGSMKQTSGDYLMVVNTNLGGGKTDSVINQDVNVNIEVTPQGEIINTVTIVKEHRGLRDTLFEGANNVDYLRLYVPKGSELIEAEGFEVPPTELFKTSDLTLQDDPDLAMLTSDFYHDPEHDVDVWQESGKTVFGSWMQTAPGEIETVSFTYRLPWRMELDNSQSLLSAAKTRLGLHNLERYSLFIQKQSGVQTRQTTVELHIPKSLELLWSSHEGLQDDGVTVSNQQDVFVHFLLER